MTTTIRKTSPGRVVVESDGCAERFGGVPVRGELICRVSVPAAVAQRYVEPDGGFQLDAFLQDVRNAQQHGQDFMGAARVLELRYVR